MRNAEVITAISAKIAAHLSEASGKTITPLTAADIENGRLAAPLLPYFTALGPDGAAQAGYTTYAYAEAPESVWGAIDALNTYIRQSRLDLNTVTPPAPNTNSAHEIPGEEQITAEEWQTRIEDWHLAQIPAAFLPDGPTGPRTDENRNDADLAVALAFGERDDWADRMAARYAPADLAVTSADPRGAAAERALAGWAALDRQRDSLVRSAHAAGVTKSRIHELTRLSRVTIDRILTPA